jgi:hypothetical protein
MQCNKCKFFGTFFCAFLLGKRKAALAAAFHREDFLYVMMIFYHFSLSFILDGMFRDIFIVYGL